MQVLLEDLRIILIVTKTCHLGNLIDTPPAFTKKHKALLQAETR